MTTIKEAQKHCAALGMILTHDRDEYRVNYRGMSERTAYYTNDLDDAILTARAMSEKGAPQLTPGQLAALARYAKANGHNWKSKLNDAWLDGRDAREPDGCYLRQVRNSFGPSWLKAYRLPE